MNISKFQGAALKDMRIPSFSWYNGECTTDDLKKIPYLERYYEQFEKTSKLKGYADKFIEKTYSIVNPLFKHIIAERSMATPSAWPRSPSKIKIREIQFEKTQRKRSRSPSPRAQSSKKPHLSDNYKVLKNSPIKTSSTKYVTNNDKGSSKRLDTCSSNTNKKLIPKSEYYEVIAKLVIEKEGRLKDNTLMNKKLLDFEEEVKTLRKKLEDNKKIIKNLVGDMKEMHYILNPKEDGEI